MLELANLEILTQFLYSFPVIVGVILCSFFFVIFRYYADSRPDGEHILVNVLLYQYSYICQIANIISAILIFSDIFNIKSDAVPYCLLFHFRAIFTILGLSYSAAITAVGAVDQL